MDLGANGGLAKFVVITDRKFYLDFGPQNGQFRCILGANFYSSAACVTCKNGYVMA